MMKVLLHGNSATWEFKQLAARSIFNHIHLPGLIAELCQILQNRAELTMGFKGTTILHSPQSRCLQILPALQSRGRATSFGGTQE